MIFPNISDEGNLALSLELLFSSFFLFLKGFIHDHKIWILIGEVSLEYDQVRDLAI